MENMDDIFTPEIVKQIDGLMDYFRAEKIDENTFEFSVAYEEFKIANRIEFTPDGSSFKIFPSAIDYSGNSYELGFANTAAEMLKMIISCPTGNVNKIIYSKAIKNMFERMVTLTKQREHTKNIRGMANGK